MEEEYFQSQRPMSEANPGPECAPSDSGSRVSSWVEGSRAEGSRAMAPYNAESDPYRRNSVPSNVRDESPPTILRRRVTTTTTTTTTTYEQKPPASDKGVMAGAVAGLLGAAVGMGMGAAALSYTMKNDKPRSVHQPISSHPRGPASEQGDWVEVDRASEWFPRQDGTVVSGRQQPHYITDHAYAGARSAAGDARSMASARPRTVVSAANGPLLLTAAEHRSQVGSQHGGSQHGGSQHGGTRSAIPAGHHTVVNGDGASRVSTRSRASGSVARSAAPAPASQVGSQHRSGPAGSTYRAPSEMDSGSHVSAARSHVSAARSQASAASSRHTVPPPAPSAYGGSTARSKAGSTVSSASTMKAPTVVRAAAPSNAGRKGSVVSARYVPLPRSTAGSSHSTRWDDLESIAPSESISCVDGPRSRVYS